MKNFVKFTCVIAIAIFAATQARASLLASDTFSYANGDLPTVSGGAWSLFSGTTGAGDVQVASGQAALTTVGHSGDDQLPLSSGQTGTKIYAGFDVNFTSWPTGNGAYFAFFKDTSTFNFQARVIVTNSASGPQIGIANGSTTPPTLTSFDGVLTLGTTYRIVIRLDQTQVAFPNTAVCTLWVDPANELSTSVTATDTLAATNTTITAFALRQSNAQQGVNTVDNLLVGTTFADVVPEPSTIVLVGAGLVGLLAMRRRRS
jgi:hypothetical protein